jgi:hypothetical protein
MKRIQLSIACLLVLGSLLSCNNTEDEEKVDPTIPTITGTAPGINSQTPVTGALNPAHGAPGHRCDIAVGAPLNSAPVNKVPSQSPVQLQQPVQMPAPVQPTAPNNPTNTVTPATTAAGLNPAHGQPGHRCEIAVGAPLNSAPATKPVTPSPLQTITPVQPAGSSTAKLNPAHGQPGHDCSIPVGQPLKQ